jgi:hypothetical protein
MISIFLEAVRLTKRPARHEMTHQAFLSTRFLSRDLSDNFFEFSVLASQNLDFVAGGFLDCIARQLLLTRLEKVLAPSLIGSRGWKQCLPCG